MSKTTDQAEYRQSLFAEKGSVWGHLWPLRPPGKTHFYANAGLSMNVPDLINSIKLRTVPWADNGKPKGPPAELGLTGY